MFRSCFCCLSVSAAPYLKFKHQLFEISVTLLIVHADTVHLWFLFSPCSNKWRLKCESNRNVKVATWPSKDRRSAASRCKTPATTCTSPKCRVPRMLSSNWRRTLAASSNLTCKMRTTRLWSVSLSDKWLPRARARSLTSRTSAWPTPERKEERRSTTRSSWFISTSARPSNLRWTRSNLLGDYRTCSKRKSRRSRTSRTRWLSLVSPRRALTALNACRAAASEHNATRT